MRTIVYDRYSTPDALELRDVDAPVVGDDDVLIRVHAAAVNPLDWHLLTGTPYLARLQAGLLAPKRHTPGVDVAGRVEAVGTNVTQFQPGDEVFGGGNGTFAEYVCVSQEVIVLKPPNTTFEQAAAVPIAAFTALQGLRDKGRIRPGHEVLINGASGGVGTFAVQIAKSFGAVVTAVCSTRNVDMVTSIGADKVIDYTAEDFTKGERRYDLIFDTVGNHTVLACRRALTSTGTYVLVGQSKKGRWLGPLPRLFKLLVVSPLGSRRLVGMLAHQRKEDLVILQKLLESGEITPVIDRRYELSDTAQAIQYQGEGHARGKIVITM